MTSFLNLFLKNKCFSLVVLEHAFLKNKKHEFKLRTLDYLKPAIARIHVVDIFVVIGSTWNNPHFKLSILVLKKISIVQS